MKKKNKKTVTKKKVAKRGRPKKSKVVKKQTKPKSKKLKKEEPKKPIKPIASGVQCSGCKQDIPQQRLDYFAKQNKPCTKCVNCSDVKTKKPIVIQQGEGDHTYEELHVVDDETYQKHKKVEDATNRMLLGKSRSIFDEEPGTNKEA